MTARPAPPSAMVKAVYKVLRDEGFAVPAGRPGHLSRRLIAAVLDNLPRAEMARAIDPLSWTWETEHGATPELSDVLKLYRDKAYEGVDAAISAARATLLSGDA